MQLKEISLFLLFLQHCINRNLTNHPKDSLRSSCRMCTQFPGCFFILSQYLLLAKKASNLQKKQKKFNFECIMYKSFINSNFDFFLEVWSFLASCKYWDRMKKHPGNCVHIRQLERGLSIFTNLVLYSRLLCVLNGW